MIILLLIFMKVSSCAFICNNGTIDPETDYCQPWAFWRADRESCECSDKEILQISCNTGYTLLRENNCLYYDHQTHITLQARCPFNSHKQMVLQTTYIQLPNESLMLNSFMCDPLNRTGLFCSHCKTGLGPALLNYSYPCLKCTKSGWTVYFTATLFPATLFCLLFIAFHIDVTSPSISYVILHSQIITSYFHQQPNSMFTRYKLPRLVFITLSGFWNLEFFRAYIPSFCVSSEMSTNTVLALEYTTALYPFFLIGIIYVVIELHASGCKVLVCMWRPLHPYFVRLRKSWNTRGSVINAFTVFFCLSYSKIMSTSFNLLYQAPITANCDLDASDRRLYLNASISANVTSMPYFYLATIIPFLFCILPLTFLLVHQTRLCRKCLSKFRVGQLLHEMAKVFEQHYRDGTGNGRDCRWMSGLYFIIRIVLSASTLASHTSYLLIALYLMFVTTLTFAIARPYKENKYNNLDTMWFANLTIVVFCGWYQLYVSYALLLVNLHLLVGLVLPLFYFVVFLLYRLVVRVWGGCCRSRDWSSFFSKRVSLNNANQFEGLPDRLLNSSEYKVLLPKREGN